MPRMRKSETMIDCLIEPVEQREGVVKVGESTFEFLRRGGRPEAIEVRENLESYFQAIPYEQRKGFKKRLQDKNFFNFMSACFELQLHQVLLRLGCDVVIEPQFAGCPKNVDFLATRDNQKFYLEATVCGLDKERFNCSDNEYFAVKRIRDELTLGCLLHSDLHLKAEGGLRNTLGRKVVEPFRKLFLKHSPDDIRRFVDQHGHEYWTYPWAFEDPPISEFECGTWKLIGWLAPPMASNGIGRVIGPGRSDLFNSPERIRTSLNGKARHWRRIKETGSQNQDGSTYLIAINVCGRHSFDEHAVSDAIFGSPTPPSHGAGEFRHGLRDTNGIIVVANGTLGYERTAQVRLYRNAGADIPNCLDSLQDTQRLGDLLGFGR